MGIENFSDNWKQKLVLIAVGAAAGVIIGLLSAQESALLPILVPILIIFAIIMFYSFRNITLPFFLLVISLTLEDVAKVPGLPNPNMVAFGGLAILAILFRFSRRQDSFKWSLGTLVALILGLWAALSAFNSGGIVTIVTKARPFLLVILLLILTQNILRKEKHFMQLGWVLALTLGAVGLLIFSEQIFAFLSSGGTLSANQIHNNANHNLLLQSPAGTWGMRLTKGIPFAVYLSLPHIEKNPKRRFLLWGCALFMIIGALSMLSVNTMFGMLITLGLMILLMRKHHRWTFVVLGILGFLVLFMATPLGERISGEYRVIVEEEDFFVWGSNRGTAWYVGVQAIRKEPIFGLGPSQNDVIEFSKRIIPADLYEAKTAKNKSGLHPHNMYLDIGSRLGIPGLIVFVTLLFAVLIPLWKVIFTQRKRSSEGFDLSVYMGQAIFIGIAAFLAQGIAISIELDKYIWLLLGMGLAYIHVFGSRSSSDKIVPVEHQLSRINYLSPVDATADVKSAPAELK